MCNSHTGVCDCCRNLHVQHLHCEKLVFEVLKLVFEGPVNRAAAPHLLSNRVD